MQRLNKLLRMKCLVFTIMAGMIFLASCGGDEEPELSEKGKLLVNHGWHISVTVINGNEVTPAPWQLDDCWYFYTDGTIFYSYGTMLSLYKEKDYSGYWKFLNEEANITYSVGETWSLAEPSIEISETQMTLTSESEGNVYVSVYVPC